MSAPSMPGSENPNATSERINLFGAADVSALLKERGWHTEAFSEVQSAWCERAAAMLGPQVADRISLAKLLVLIFEYDARAILHTTDAHVILSRNAARDVIRHVARLLLDDSPLTVTRFNEIITSLKEHMDFRSRDLFHPLRLALAGRVGEGELDRVVLLLDEATAAGFTHPVKTARTRILEFCAALD